MYILLIMVYFIGHTNNWGYDHLTIIFLNLDNGIFNVYK